MLRMPQQQQQQQLLLPTSATSAAAAASTSTEAIEQERGSPDAFSQQPYYFMELACLLLEHAKSCFPSDDEYMQVRFQC